MKMRLNFLILIGICIIFSRCDNSKPPQNTGIEVSSSNPKLDSAFVWAVNKATSFVMTGKSGVVDKHEKSEGEGNVAYIPSYWAGYPFRTAFYSRDFCHQAVGAHLLQLNEENFTMLKEFAKSANEERKWYPLWAINFDGSLYKLDYKSDSSFVREVPAVFELVEKGYQLYSWSGDKRYIEDPVLWNYYTKAVTDFVTLHDALMPNGVAEGSGTGSIFRGTATFNEHEIPFIEAGDGIAAQYKAFESYALMAQARGEEAVCKQYKEKADQLKRFFNETWGAKENEANYVRGYDVNNASYTDWGKENSWFIPLKKISYANDKTDNYLRFIDSSASTEAGVPKNIEAVSYLPETFFNNNKNELGWKWMEYIIEHLSDKHPTGTTGENANYPEISYVLISNLVEGLMGIKANAPKAYFSTLSGLPKSIDFLSVRNINIGNSVLNVKHEGYEYSVVDYVSGTDLLMWEIQFAGGHSLINVNGKDYPAKQKSLDGTTISYIEHKITTGSTYTTSVHKAHAK